MSQAHETAEADYGIANTPRHLVDDKVIDLADVVAISTVNFRALDVVARYASMIGVSSCSRHCDLL
jgi:hypothetical protein